MRVVVALLLFVSTGAAFANTITVTTTADVVANDAECSLREAIEAANTNVGVSGCTGGSGADTIVLAAGTYDVLGAAEDANASGDLDITEALTIKGAGADLSILSAGTGAQDRVIDVTQDVAVTLIDLGITNGKAPAGGDGGGIRTVGELNVLRCAVTQNAAGEHPNQGQNGGGIWTSKTNGLVLKDSVIAANTSGACVGNAAGRAGNGAGIYMRGGEIVRTLFAANQVGSAGACTPSSGASTGGAIHNVSGALFIEQSSITGNQSPSGAGIFVSATLLNVKQSSFVGNTSTEGASAIEAYETTASVENSTFSGNEAELDAGAIRLIAVSTNSANLTHTTLVNNTGGGLSVEGTDLAVGIRNSLVAGNRSASMELGYDCLRSSVNVATLGSAGYNVFGTEPVSASRGCPFSLVYDVAQVDAVVGALVESAFATSPGQLTQFLAPRAGSSLVDSGICTNGAGQPISVDQRGNARLCACDIGAIELQKPSVRVTDQTMSAACGNGPATRVEALDCAGNVLDIQDICVSSGGIVGPAGANGTTGPTGGLGAAGVQGAQGEAGRNGTKIKTEKLATGDEACREGGLRITVGDDIDADGALTGTEIADTQTLCNPPQPAAGCGATDAAPLAMIGALLLLRRRRRA